MKKQEACNYPRGEEVQINHNIGLHDSICTECQYIPNAINMDEYKILTVQEKIKTIKIELDLNSIVYNIL